MSLFNLLNLLGDHKDTVEVDASPLSLVQADVINIP